MWSQKKYLLLTKSLVHDRGVINFLAVHTGLWYVLRGVPPSQAKNIRHKQQKSAGLARVIEMESQVANYILLILVLIFSELLLEV